MRLKSLWILALLALSGLAPPSAGQQATPAQGLSIFASEPALALAWDARITALEAAGELERVGARADPIASAWFHERFQQRYRGLRVFGAQLLRHRQGGRVVTVNGRYYEGIRLDTTPGIAPGQARLAAERAAGAGARALGEPELLVYPAGGGLQLAYRVHLRTRDDLQIYFLEAATGNVIDRWSDLRRQAAVVGKGTGTWQDTKKVSVTQQAGAFLAIDRLRPTRSLTVDVEGNFRAWNLYEIDPERSAARDPDNDWIDGAVVDAHVYAGWVYDYYFKRFGHRGLDGADRPSISYVHFWLRNFGSHPLLYNAFWDTFDASVNYGDGDGVDYNFFSSALDIVAHELTHGVTQFSSDLIYRNESGALNESFSDIMGTGAEFFFEPRGFGRQRSDWGQGEDVIMVNFIDQRWYVFRYFADPLALGDPDHYSLRFRGSEDNGGVHTNSSISNHAFYLFVEGGKNRTSGIQVAGIGFRNIERAEKIFFRAFTSYLVPSSQFSDARQATLQSARDLYGAGGREEQELALAWDAVGVR